MSDKKPWEKTVEYDEHLFDLDMRKLHSREFISELASLQENGEEPSWSDQIKLFEKVFDGSKAYEQIKEYVTNKYGFEDYIEILRVEGELFALADLKN